MGYTHYWRQTRAFTPSEWARLKAAVRGIIARTAVPLADGMGQGAPVINGDRVWLNGAEPDSFESFIIARDPEALADDYQRDTHAQRGYWLEFCKTGWRPYDKVVVACLLAASHICEGFTWSSDGDREDHAEGERLAALLEIPYTSDDQQHRRTL